MSEKAWASLAPFWIHDVTSNPSWQGLKVSAHAEFRICVTMNDDASTFEIPEYIHSRLQPQIYLDFPEADEEKRILQENLPFVKEEILDYVVTFLQKAHLAEETYTVRDGINIARYAAKRLEALNGRAHAESILRQAIVMTLGEEAAIHTL